MTESTEDIDERIAIARLDGRDAEVTALRRRRDELEREQRESAFVDRERSRREAKATEAARVKRLKRSRADARKAATMVVKKAEEIDRALAALERAAREYQLATVDLSTALRSAELTDDGGSRGSRATPRAGPRGPARPASPSSQTCRGHPRRGGRPSRSRLPGRSRTWRADGMALSIRKVRGRDVDALSRQIHDLERELRDRLRVAQTRLGMMSENEAKIGDLDELIRAVVDAEEEIAARDAAPLPRVPKPPKGSEEDDPFAGPSRTNKSSRGGKEMDDIAQLEAIEKLAHAAGADAREIRKSAEDLYDAVVDRYRSDGADASRAHYLAMRDPIGERAYNMANEMTERELRVRDALGR